MGRPGRLFFGKFKTVHNFDPFKTENIQSIGRKWRKMSKAAKSGFSNPVQEPAPPADIVTNEKQDIINQLNELTNQRQEISDEKEKLTSQIKKIGIEKKKIAYERAQLEYEKEELINQLLEFTKIASEDELPIASCRVSIDSQSIHNKKPTGWSTDEFVEDLDDSLTAE